MQQENKWNSSTASDTSRSFMPLQTNYPYNSTEYSQQSESNPNNTVLPGMSTNTNNGSQSNIAGLMSGSQPGTPKPATISPINDKQPTTPDLIRRRPPLPSRPASFTTTTFHSNPYPNNVPLRRRRTESSMFSFETGPNFSPTKQSYELCSMDQSNGYQVQLHAKMDRGFFRSDQDWTCYRRNYFQVSSTFDVHGMNYLLQGPEVPCLLRSENQEFYQIDFFTIGITARITGSDKKIELVQHTPKRDKGPQMVPEPRVVNAGGNLHLASVGSNHNIVTFERMQFKTATANNGKRRAAQQYYEIVVDLYANSATGKSFKVASCVSVPLVVRGRSPGHYADSHTRYRSGDAGPTPPVPFANGQAITPTPQPPSSSSFVNSSRYPSTDFNSPYPSYQQPPPPPPSSYPYPVGGFTPLHHMNPTRHEDGNPQQHRDGSYLVQPSPYHPLPSPTQQDKTPYWSNNIRDSPSEPRYATNYNMNTQFNSYHPMRQNPSNQSNSMDSTDNTTNSVNNDNKHYLNHSS